MNAMPLAAPPPLLDMLGARWRVGVSVASVAWDEVAAFALGDGTLALVPPSWEGAPSLRPRDGGGVELVPATAAAPPAARISAHHAACLSVAADPDGGFLSGGSDGRVVRVLPDAEVRVIAHLDRAVALVAAGRGGWRSCAIGRTVYRFGGAGSKIDLAGEVTSLAVEPAGARLAIGFDGGLALWAGGDTPRVLASSGAHCVAWGARLGSCTRDGTLHAWEPAETAAAGGPVGALAVASDGFIAASGGRVLAWRPGDPPRACGVPNKEPVTRVACHPDRMLIAAGYANGAVVLCQPDTEALLHVRAAGEGAVTALGFSPSGDHLAIGTEAGEIAVLATPDLLFRDNKRPA
jgi:WD40 repeat protein